MRVALVTPTLLVGGLERVVRDLAVALARRDVVTRVFVTGRAGVYAEGLAAAGVRVRSCDRPRPRSLRVPIGLVRELRDFRPTVIHGHSGTWWPCTAAKRALGYPRLVFTDHGRYLPEPKSRAVVEKQVYLRSTDRLVAVSRELGEYLQVYLGLRDPPEVIPNGIELADYAARDPRRRAGLRRQWGVTDREIVALAVGRLEPVKNHLGLLEAMAEARRAARGLRLVIVGTGRLETRLRSRAEELGIGEVTRFLGHRHDLPDCLGAADIFVSASDSEGLPVSLLEALASGLPVVATAVGGIPDALGRPPAGVLVPPRETAALAAALAGLADEPGRRAKIAATARRRSQAFSLEACVQRYHDLYVEVLTDKAFPRAAELVGG